METAMTIERAFKRFAMLLALLCLVSGAQAQSGRRFTTVDFPGYYSYNAPLGINNAGSVAGFYDDAFHLFHGYVRLHGRFITVDYPGALMTSCGGINDLDVVCGTYIDMQGFQHGFLWHQGRFRPLDVPFASQNTSGVIYESGPGLGTAAFGLNLFNNVVGQYADAAGTSRGWVLVDGRYHTVDAPGADAGPGLGTIVFNINALGSMAGSYHTALPPYVHGWVSRGGVFVPIDMPGAGGSFGTQASGLNNLGDIVGVYTDAQDGYHGMLVHKGVYSSVDFPGGFDSECHAINDLGDVTGLYYGMDGRAHGFIMTQR